MHRIEVIDSHTGSVFEASYREQDGKLWPRVSGQAYVTAQATLLIDDADPLAWGIGS
jgi:proline racemase